MARVDRKTWLLVALATGLLAGALLLVPGRHLSFRGGGVTATGVNADPALTCLRTDLDEIVQKLAATAREETPEPVGKVSEPPRRDPFRSLVHGNGKGAARHVVPEADGADRRPVCSAVLLGRTGWVAIIDGSPRRVGDRLHGAVVERIDQSGVWLRGPGGENMFLAIDETREQRQATISVTASLSKPLIESARSEGETVR